MRTLLSHPALLLASRFIVGTVFIVASIDKIAYPAAFAESILAYGVMPYPLVNLTALFVPWLELLCGVFLLGGKEIRPSATLLAALLGIFIVLIVSALVRGLKIDCGCFGKEHATPVSWMKVLEDCALLLLAWHAARYGAPGGGAGAAPGAPPAVETR